MILTAVRSCFLSEPNTEYHALLTVLCSKSWLNIQPQGAAETRVNSTQTELVIQDGSTSIGIFLPFIATLFFPLFALLAMVFWRREEALGNLAGVKSSAVR